MSNLPIQVDIILWVAVVVGVIGAYGLVVGTLLSTRRIWRNRNLR